MEAPSAILLKADGSFLDSIQLQNPGTLGYGRVSRQGTTFGRNANRANAEVPDAVEWVPGAIPHQIDSHEFL